MEKDSALVCLLRDASAVPFVKTNVPITLLSFESYSDVFGRTTSPHRSTHSPGGSTGGEAALLAYGGSRLGIGTDVAGSVRVPAHYSGVYTIKASTGRFVKTGSASSMPGQEGVGPVYSPMTRTLEDLEMFWKAIISMKPWTYDPTVGFQKHSLFSRSAHATVQVSRNALEKRGFVGENCQMGCDVG
jgi:Asp-tRNA(Asn)/Glu-tRNA(Gln) amidotransferase A subunit family amidase